MARSLTAAEIPPDQLAFFEAKIRPVLVDQCYKCHSTESGKAKGGLLLDTRAALLKGGDNGPSFTAGEPEKSRLIEAIRWSDPELKMPPKTKLDAAQITALEAWVKMGAPDPREETARPPAIAKFIEQAKTHWAFQPLAKSAPPAVQDAAWVRNDVDRYILAGLQQTGLQPSPEADRRTLLRRVSFDLIGLPPTPEEVDAFVKDESPQAYERLVDRLLASPHYGERWGRHWLDLARYADSSGYHNDLDRPNAWRYRDYVIRSFNEDKPYARFVAEQLAGDEIDGADEETLVATGFCRNGPSNDDNMGKSAAALAQYRVDQLDNVISTTASVFLGVTLGCARCHDHKTDPFTARDYYSLLAIFNGTEKLGLAKGAKDQDEKDIKDTANVLALVETKAKVPATYVLLRGLALSKGAEVPPAAPGVLAPTPLRFPEPAPGAKSSGRRRTLAEWIGAPDNALTWRVLANRIWQHHFGQGLVTTPSNFGFNGERPSHPELLDYLAARLVANGGQMKPLHKEILMSAAYRQASAFREDGRQIDPQNTRLWRMNKQRLEAEVLRDGILAVSGKLNLEMGGPGIKPRIRAELLPASQRNKWPQLEQEGPEQWRRSVYIYVKRQLLMPMMELFDAPTTIDSCAQRTPSVVPTQALVLMNDEFMEDHAGFLAQRAGEPLAQGVARMYELAMSHPAGEARLQQATAFVQDRERAYSEEKSDAARLRALTDLAHVLLNSSEFLYVE
ncbi:MAG TPA: PSD1 and planctomycete cytochrome C domain-containing protein [Chthoniobacteraceae bacterium]|nr:PSD1 and planctomycete cytochrome C domain-containing protein [Chthoniobacteraceae bacterium]